MSIDFYRHPPGRLWGMARKPRVEVDGAFYHVIGQGNCRETVFHDSGDYIVAESQ